MIHRKFDADELVITLTTQDEGSERLIQAALADLKLEPCNVAGEIALEVTQIDSSTWQLTDNRESLARTYHSSGDLIYQLSDRIVFHLADKLKQRHCLHAAAVQIGDHACVIPAKSGSGKSSLTAWLVANQFPYITDELILVNPDQKIEGVARPIQIKTKGLSVITPLLKSATPYYAGKLANAITAAHLGGKVASAEAKHVGLILFPEYCDQANYQLLELSSAEAGLALMSNHVNARNLKDHGFRAMMKLIRETPCYALNYGGFDQLPDDFTDTLTKIAGTKSK